MPRHWVDTTVARAASITVFAFLFTLMLSVAMTRVVGAFHERRDLDLLLTAPVSALLVLVVRSLTVAAAVAALFAIFFFPLADSGLAAGHWWMARFYAIVPLMAMLATGVALALTGAVVRLLGVRRARVGLQVFSAIVGASMYFVSQARQFLPAAWSEHASERLQQMSRMDASPWPVLLAKGVVGGEGEAWLVFATASIGVFGLAVVSASRRFHEVARTPEADGRVVASVRATVDRRVARGFGGGLFRTLLTKEWRLVVRSPQLISQILLQLLYLMPLLFVAFGGGPSGVAWSASAFAAGVVGITGTLATSLAWLTVSAEDAPDLLASSPTDRGWVLAAKLAASTLPPVFLVVLASLGTMRRSPADGAIVLAFGILSCLSAAILAASSGVTGKRSDFQRRHPGSRLAALIEGFQFLVWGGAAGTAVAGLWDASIPLALLACVLPAVRLPRALRRLDDIDR